MATATEPLWRAGAVGHQRTRLVGGPRRRDFTDQHDRRCDEPVVRAFREERLHGREHEPSRALSEAAWAAAGVLHRQSVVVPNGGEDESRREPERKRSGGVATDADRSGSAGVGNSVDRGTQSAGERESRERISDRAGPAGEGDAGGRGEDPGGSKPLPGNGVSAVGEGDAGGGAGESG